MWLLFLSACYKPIRCSPVIVFLLVSGRGFVLVCLGVVKMSVVLLLDFYKPRVCVFMMIAAVRTF